MTNTNSTVGRRVTHPDPHTAPPTPPITNSILRNTPHWGMHAIQRDYKDPGAAPPRVDHAGSGFSGAGENRAD